MNYIEFRGAELIEELRSKEMKVEQEHEIEVLQKLKAKMDRIKATQQKLLESVKEPAHHAKGKSILVCMNLKLIITLKANMNVL